MLRISSYILYYKKWCYITHWIWFKFWISSFYPPSIIFWCNTVFSIIFNLPILPTFIFFYFPQDLHSWQSCSRMEISRIFPSSFWSKLSYWRVFPVQTSIKYCRKESELNASNDGKSSGSFRLFFILNSNQRERLWRRELVGLILVLEVRAVKIHAGHRWSQNLRL